MKEITIGVIPNATKPECIHLSRKIVKWLKKERPEVTIRMMEETAYDSSFYDTREVLASQYLIIIGGDGTVLRWGREAAQAGCRPLILGINMGTLGFVTEVDVSEWQSSIEKILNKEFQISDRIILQAEYLDKVNSEIRIIYGVNDLVVKSQSDRMLRLNTWINNKLITTHNADGLLFSTPTGSTGYCLSAGGSIIYPDLDIIQVIPINPHTLSSRPVVLPSDVKITINTDKDFNDLKLVADGQTSISLPFTGKNETITIQKSNYSIRLIEIKHDSFYSKLTNRLEWGRGIR